MGVFKASQVIKSLICHGFATKVDILMKISINALICALFMILTRKFKFNIVVFLLRMRTHLLTYF